MSFDHFENIGFPAEKVVMRFSPESTTNSETGDDQVDGALGYSPCMALILDSFSHSRDV